MSLRSAANTLTLVLSLSLLTLTSAQNTTSTYTISPASFPNLCIAPSSSSDGSSLVLASCSTSSDIVWTASGSTLQNTATNLCADVTGGWDYSGNDMQVWNCYSNNHHQMFTSSTGDQGLIKWSGKNMCWDLTDGAGVEGTQIQIWSCASANPNQQWVFTEAEEVDGDECDASSVTSSSTLTAGAVQTGSVTASITASVTESVTIGGELWAGGGSHSNSSTSGSNPSQTGSATTAASATTASATTASTTKSTSTSGYLQVSGTAVVDSNNNVVNLKGTNLGGWLVLEDWMCGITDNSGSGDRFAQTTLENRFGVDATWQLMQTWQDNWLVSSDFDKIAALGFNVVRLPFSYRNFIWPNGSYVTDSSGDVDFSRLDWAVAQAKSRGIYVIPTYHIWDGQADDYSAVSKDTSTGQSQRDLMGTLWGKIATHFLGETTIAAYDAINEPTGSANNKLQTDLYNSIRAADPSRIIIMESINAAPSSDWSNVMYSLHEYLMMGSDTSYNQNMWNTGAATDVNLWQSWNVPVYVGEFMADDSTLEWMLDQINGMSNVWWSGWTYKTVNMGRWGLYNTGHFSVDVQNDDWNSISDQWSNSAMGQLNEQAVALIYKSKCSGSSRKREEGNFEVREEVKRFNGHGGRSRRFSGHGIKRVGESF